MTPLLITKQTVADCLQVAIGYNETEFNNFIREAQTFDLKPLLREEFYYDLIENIEDPIYAGLMDGGTYDYEGREYRYSGLNMVLSYFTFARFKLNSSAVSTSHGFVTKTTPNSEPLSLTERRNDYYEKQRQANILFEDTKRYVERNIDLFPNWDETGRCRPRLNGGGSSTFVIQ